MHTDATTVSFIIYEFLSENFLNILKEILCERTVKPATQIDI